MKGGASLKFSALMAENYRDRVSAAQMKQVLPRQLRIQYILLLILVSISVLPLWFFGWRMVSMNKGRLETQEKILQTTLSKSLAQQIQLYVENVRQQVKELFDAVAPLAVEVRNSKYEDDPQMERALEDSLADQPGVIYVTVLNAEARGRGAQATQASGFNAGSDTFVRKALEAAFLAARQGQRYESNPLTAVGPRGSELVMVMAEPIERRNTFLGMVAAVVTLRPLGDELAESRRLGLEACIVDNSGRTVASNNPDQNVAGLDMVSNPIVQKFLAWRGRAHLTETSEYNLVRNGRVVPMLGTYSPTLSGRWGVILQKKKSDAFMSVIEMRDATIRLGLLVIIISLMVAVFASKSITRPIAHLARTARAIAARDFSVRADVRNRTEIGELAQGFNIMAEDLQQYISDLKRASEENRQLFIDSIEMMAAAVDAKDPYTKGHSSRVSQYSMILAKEIGLDDLEVELVRDSATLHDVGKIGVDDQVLRKPGVLTDEEFELMKRHTIMGFEIVRQVQQLAGTLPAIRWHHESLDGSGYPDGINGDEIPLLVRIVAVADTFDAVTTDRPYQTGCDFPSALEILKKHAGTRYDPIVVDALHSAYAKGYLRKFEMRRRSQVPGVEVRS
ncbi:MAG TPA: HD domain-containing phosphohydrolase [Terriglobia bacterium]|nr:HD domain-containing phosphohydrolase [Terriglobia bacterium]